MSSSSAARQLAEFVAASDEVHTAFVEAVFSRSQTTDSFVWSPTLPDLRETFVRNDFNIRRLMEEIAVAAALSGIRTDSLFHRNRPEMTTLHQFERRVPAQPSLERRGPAVHRQSAEPRLCQSAVAQEATRNRLQPQRGRSLDFLARRGRRTLHLQRERLKPLEPFRKQMLTLHGICDRVRGDGDQHMRGIAAPRLTVELFPGNVLGGCTEHPAGWSRGNSSIRSQDPSAASTRIADPIRLARIRSHGGGTGGYMDANGLRRPE